MSRTHAIVSAVCFTLAACSSGGSPSSTGGTTNGGTGGSGGALPYAGEVTLATVDIEGSTSYLASASFATAISVSLSGGCTPSTSTPCCFTSVSADAGISFDAGAQVPASAGAIAISDGANALGTLVFVADAGLTDYTELTSDTTPGLTWNPGDQLTISAAGSANGVDAFSATVIVPPTLTDVVPALSLTSPISVSTSTPLTLTWSGGAESNASVLINLLAIGGETAAAIVCTAPVGLGTFTIPTSMLSQLPAHGGGELTLTPALDTAPTSPAPNATTLIQVIGIGAIGSITLTP
jgi:hypothetical protein